MPKPPAAAVADPVNRNGISRWPSCQAGTAVSHSSTDVYAATAGPSAAAGSVAARPARGSLRVTAEAAAPSARGV